MDLTSTDRVHLQRPASLSFDIEPERPITDRALASITDHDTSNITIDPTAAYAYVTSGLSPGMKLAGTQKSKEPKMQE